MTKIAFDVKFRPQIESGEYRVETRDGKPARIICWDFDSQAKQPIVACVNGGNYFEYLATYSSDGAYWQSKETNDDDLFVITTEESGNLLKFDTFPRVMGEHRDLAIDLASENDIWDDEVLSKVTGKRKSYAIAFKSGFDAARKVYQKKTGSPFSEQESQIITAAIKWTLKEKNLPSEIRTLRRILLKYCSEEKPTQRIPSVGEFEFLLDTCEHKWDSNRNGMVVTSRNGNAIFFPSCGYCDSEGKLYGVDTHGNYWTSTTCATNPVTFVKSFHFDEGLVSYDTREGTCSYLSVRTVSDVPMDGFVDMGNGLYWAKNNFTDYCPFTELEKVVNKK